MTDRARNYHLAQELRAASDLALLPGLPPLHITAAGYSNVEVSVCLSSLEDLLTFTIVMAQHADLTSTRTQWGDGAVTHSTDFTYRGARFRAYHYAKAEQVAS